MRYVYLRDKKKLSKVSLELESTGIFELPRRTLIGGQRISWEMLRSVGLTEPEDSGKDLNVYGILSRVLSAEVVSGVSDYQLAALYQLDSFDDIISKYGSDSEARFLITSQQGLIFYDSNSHMGLCNVHNRLKIAFGRESHVEIISNASEPGVEISLVFGKQLRIGEGDLAMPKS